MLEKGVKYIIELTQPSNFIDSKPNKVNNKIRAGKEEKLPKIVTIIT